MDNYEDVEFRELEGDGKMEEKKSFIQKAKEFCMENNRGVLILGGALFGLIQYKRGYKKGLKLGMREGSNQFCRDLVDSIMSESANVTKF